jgi:hypothetical protein
VIVAVHGVPGLSFAELTYFLTELGIGFVAVIKSPVKVGSPNKDRVVPIVFSSAKSLLENRDKIKFRSVAFVCDSYQRLHNELNWNVVGVRELGRDRHEYIRFERQEIGELIQKADKLRTPATINTSVKVYNPTVRLIEKFADSALAKSHTLMHRIKNQDQRAKTFALVKGWFTGQVKGKDVLYTKLSHLHKNDKYLETLMLVLTNKEGMMLRQVVIEGKMHPDKIDGLAKGANVSPFDIRYLLSGPKK